MLITAPGFSQASFIRFGTDSATKPEDPPIPQPSDNEWDQVPTTPRTAHGAQRITWQEKLLKTLWACLLLAPGKFWDPANQFMASTLEKLAKSVETMTVATPGEKWKSWKLAYPKHYCITGRGYWKEIQATLNGKPCLITSIQEHNSGTYTSSVGPHGSLRLSTPDMDMKIKYRTLYTYDGEAYSPEALKITTPSDSYYADTSDRIILDNAMKLVYKVFRNLPQSRQNWLGELEDKRKNRD